MAAGALIPAAAAALSAALWLRAPRVPYLAAIVLATAAALGLAWTVRRGRGWLAVFAAAVATFVVPAIATQRELRRIEGDWPAFQAERVQGSVDRLAGELDRAARELRGVALAGLDVPVAVEAAFARSAELTRQRGAERALLLSSNGRPFAWGGTVRVPPDSLPGRPLAVSITPFYVVLHASADRGDRRALATELVHATPPADTLVDGLDGPLHGRGLVRRFDYAIPAAVPPGDAAWRLVSATIDGRAVPLVAVRPVPYDSGQVHERAKQGGSERAGPPLVAMLLVFAAAAWWGRTGLARRLLALAVPLATVAIVPLSIYSNATRLFDPALYFAPVGWRFTGSMGALAITSALVLLGLFAVLRSGMRVPSRVGAGALVVGIAVGAPYLLRELSRGITPPSLGAPVSLWMEWQVTLFLAAAAVLVAGAAAGRAALGPARGLPAMVAPVLAAIAALAGPALWMAPASWPRWYPLLWIAAVVALALTRRSRAMVIAASTVAGLASATLVWGTTARRRVELAQRDLAGLVSPDLDALRLLDRFGRALASDAPPTTPARLLGAFAESPLAATDFPVSLASWSGPLAGDSVVARVATASTALDSVTLRDVLQVARRAGTPQLATVLSDYGAVALLAVPHDEGRVTAVAVFPRARLAPDDPGSSLLGLPRPATGEPPYTVLLLERRRVAVRAPMLPRWSREGNEIRGDLDIPTPDGSARAHAEVALRPLSALAQRGALLTFLDVAIAGVLWALPVVADGGVARRLRLVTRGWWRSYRARLTLALFAFFVIPATVFAVWAYQQLRAGDLQSRELLLRESLRTAAEVRFDSLPVLRTAAQRRGAPLLVYQSGMLVRASDPLFASLAPIGLLLPPNVALPVAFGDEPFRSRHMRAGPSEALFGFRAASGPRGSEYVLAAPARIDDASLDQRRRDLGFLVLLAVAGGGLAALWLSRLAGRELARPVGTLKRAALAVAAGEREPSLTGDPPAEFRPVFDAFRRMAGDLAASETALEAARRRTADVLRHVASGVLAVDADGRVVIANPRASTLLGHAIGAGDQVEAVCPPPLAARVHEFLRARQLAPEVTAEAAIGDGTRAGEDAFELAHGGRQLRARLTPLADRERGRGAAVLTVDDLTELARAQRVLAWGEMARQVAHEIKNPLTPIRLGVQHLRRAHRDGRQDFEAILERNVERILAEIDRLDEIARAFSRYGTAPDQRAPAEPVDVAMIARDVVALERMGQAQAAVDWQLEGADGAMMALARDEELREVLLNILENARLAGARTVRVGVGCADGEVSLVVEDDGEGIADDVMSRVFEPHFSTRTSGSGLGLAISRRLVDGWGGAITLTSQRGRGTAVRITLRAAASGAREGGARD